MDSATGRARRGRRSHSTGNPRASVPVHDFGLTTSRRSGTMWRPRRGLLYNCRRRDVSSAAPAQPRQNVRVCAADSRARLREPPVTSEPGPDFHQVTHQNFLRRPHEAGAAVDVCMSGDVRRVIGTRRTGTTAPSPTTASERMFLPRDMFWGYGQFDLAPPHNEIDPNLCRADAGISGGVNDPCNAFARYMLSGYVEAQALWPDASSAGSFCLENPDSCLARIFRRRFTPGRWTRSEWRTLGRGNLPGQGIRNAGDPAFSVHPVWSAGPESGAGGPRAQRPLGTLQHDRGAEIFRDEAVLRVC